MAKQQSAESLRKCRPKGLPSTHTPVLEDDENDQVFNFFGACGAHRQRLPVVEPPMRTAGAEKADYLIIFIIFQHRRLPRREAFGATFLESFERVAHLEFW